MKRTKYQIQRRWNFNGHEELKDYGRTLTPLKALKRMEELAFVEIETILSYNLEITISRTSDSRYPNAWGMANNGILIKTELYWVQWEVVEA